MDPVGFIFGFGLLQGLILAAILLAARSGHRLANGIMAALVVAIALNLLQSWLIRLGYYLEHPAAALIIPPLDFVWGPLLYLYAYSLTGGTVHNRQLAHFLPTAVFLLAANVPFWTFSEAQQSNFVSYLWSLRTDTTQQQEVWTYLVGFWRIWVEYHLHSSFFVLQFALYCLLVLRRIKYHNQRLQQHFSSMEFMNLRWLRTLTLACLAFLLIFLVFNRMQVLLAGHFDINALAASTPSLFLVVLIYVIAISAIFQPSLVSGVSAALGSNPNRETQPQAEPREPAAPGPDTARVVQAAPVSQADTAAGTGKYERSGLNMDDAQRYKMMLMQAMQEEELYLDCELTLPDLAQHTGLTPHQVSQVINGQMNQNFFSFVNNYRIQLAKKLLTDPASRNMPIVELAVEVGFKSKSSFYDAFKKATQMTPTQFKKMDA
jgi:AraC-like DNA-binding protein